MQTSQLGLLTLFVPQLTWALTYGHDNYEAGQSRLLAIFAGFNVLAFLLIFFFVPETAGAILSKEEGSLNYISLEELNYIFGVPTLQHIRYQLNSVVPWAYSVVVWTVSHYVLRKEVEKPQDLHVLYTWVDIRSVERARKKRKEK
jgi:cytochrome b561